MERPFVRGDDSLGRGRLPCRVVLEDAPERPGVDDEPKAGAVLNVFEPGLLLPAAEDEDQDERPERKHRHQQRDRGPDELHVLQPDHHIRKEQNVLQVSEGINPKVADCDDSLVAHCGLRALENLPRDILDVERHAFDDVVRNARHKNHNGSGQCVEDLDKEEPNHLRRAMGGMEVVEPEDHVQREKYAGREVEEARQGQPHEVLDPVAHPLGGQVHGDTPYVGAVNVDVEVHQQGHVVAPACEKVAEEMREQAQAAAAALLHPRLSHPMLLHPRLSHPRLSRRRKVDRNQRIRPHGRACDGEGQDQHARQLARLGNRRDRLRVEIRGAGRDPLRPFSPGEPSPEAGGEPPGQALGSIITGHSPELCNTTINDEGNESMRQYNEAHNEAITRQ